MGAVRVASCDGDAAEALGKVLAKVPADIDAGANAGAPNAAALPCPGPALRIEAVAPGVWWIPGAAGEANATNRGAISNALAVRDGPRLWLLGSGPSAAHGRALGCRLQRLTGRPVSDVIAPWARPELVLGQDTATTRHFAREAQPAKLPPKPFSTIGANVFLRFKEWRARAE